MDTSSSPSSRRREWPGTIALVTDYYPPGRPGGLGEIASALKRAYERAGLDVRVVSTGPAREREDGVLRVGSGPAHLGAASFVLPLLLRGADLIHVHHASAPGLYAAKALLGRRVPPVVTTFQCSAREEIRQVRPRTLPDGHPVEPRPPEYVYKYVTGPLHCLADQMGMRISDAVTAVSRSCLADCRRFAGRPRGGLWWVPNGVDPDRFRPGTGGAEIRARFGTGRGLLLLYVGALRMRKGIHDLLPALKEIARTRPGTRLLIVGGGRGYEPSLKALAHRLGVGELVHLIPPVENESLPPFYDAADAVIIPSLFEGLPLVLLEAMAQARPVVATSVDGMADVLEDRVTGHVVPPGEPGAIARRVEEIARDPEGSARMGDRARRKVERLYSWDAVARRYLEIFEGLGGTGR